MHFMVPKWARCINKLCDVLELLDFVNNSNEQRLLVENYETVGNVIREMETNSDPADGNLIHCLSEKGHWSGVEDEKRG